MVQLTSAEAARRLSITAVTSYGFCKQKGLVEVQRRTRVVYAYLYALIRK